MSSVVDLFDAPLEPELDRLQQILSRIGRLGLHQQIDFINQARQAIHQISPFKHEPVDCVLWVPAEAVVANDYNPNTVAPPEMKLLAHSISQDGYTQPIVAWRNDDLVEVVDGFHRHRVGKENKEVQARIHGYLPVTIINDARLDRNDRISATIRHNRARGKHKVEAMSDIVVELKRRNWTDERICRELGMEQDEVLRLCQITGLAELFTDQEFSKSWDVEGDVNEADFAELSDDVESYGEEAAKFRAVNTSDESRIFHTHEKWECYRAGFYATTKEGMTKAQCEEAYRDFLADISRFSAAMEGVVSEWKHSCEHYLTNVAMNRLAWLGQASACYAMGIPAVFRSGFYLLTPEQQETANRAAHEYLNKWLTANGREAISFDEANTDRQSDIY